MSAMTFKWHDCIMCRGEQTFFFSLKRAMKIQDFGDFKLEFTQGFSSVNMAPIATTSEPQPDTTYAKKGTADYKEAGGGLRDYNSKLEEEGEEKAHVDVLCSPQ